MSRVYLHGSIVPWLTYEMMFCPALAPPNTEMPALWCQSGCLVFQVWWHYHEKGSRGKQQSETLAKLRQQHLQFYNSSVNEPLAFPFTARMFSQSGCNEILNVLANEP